MKISQQTFENSTKLSQNFIKILNKTTDQDQYASEYFDEIQYMKRYYEMQNCLSKLQKLVQYYCNTQQNLLYLHPCVKLIRNKNISDSIKTLNPQISQQSFDFRFYNSHILTSSILNDQPIILTDSFYLNGLLQKLKSKQQLKQQQLIKKQDYSVQLNYIPYKCKNKFKGKKTQIKYELENVKQRKPFKIKKN